MAKEKRNLYEEVEFGNDYGYAMQVKREAETQLYEIQKIWGLAIAGTVCGGIGMVLAFHPIFIVSYTNKPPAMQVCPQML